MGRLFDKGQRKARIAKKETRACLKCDRKFTPIHRFNRICPSCKIINKKLSDQAEGFNEHGNTENVTDLEMI